MRVELPEGYVPPEPTHPLYGYLTPEELEAYEAEERSRLGIVPEAPAPGSEESESALEVEVQTASPWAPPSPTPPAPAPGLSAEAPAAVVVAGPELQEDLPDFSPAAAEESPLTEETDEDELTVPGGPLAVTEPAAVVEAPPSVPTGWVPPPPPPPVEPEPMVQPEPVVEQTHRREPATFPVTAPAAEPEYRWDAYQQKWVTAAPSPAPVPGEAGATPPPDHAAAAGGRGASSSWTSADGQRFRWDARTQQWIVAPAVPPEPPA